MNNLSVVHDHNLFQIPNVSFSKFDQFSTVRFVDTKGHLLRPFKKIELIAEQNFILKTYLFCSFSRPSAVTTTFIVRFTYFTDLVSKSIIDSPNMSLRSSLIKSRNCLAFLADRIMKLLTCVCPGTMFH